MCTCGLTSKVGFAVPEAANQRVTRDLQTRYQTILKRPRMVSCAMQSDVLKFTVIHPLLHLASAFIKGVIARQVCIQRLPFTEND